MNFVSDTENGDERKLFDFRQSVKIYYEFLHSVFVMLTFKLEFVGEFEVGMCIVGRVDLGTPCYLLMKLC